MAIMYFPRVLQITTTEGTGAYDLSGTTPTGYQSFKTAIPVSIAQVFYCCTNDTDWEYGLGGYNLESNTLTRDRFISSSYFNTNVDWVVGDKKIFITFPYPLLNQISGYWSNETPNENLSYDYGMCIGNNNTIGSGVTSHSTIIGDWNNVDSPYSYVIGSGNMAATMFSFLIGHDNSAKQVENNCDKNYAFGNSNAITDSSNSYSFGRSNHHSKDYTFSIGMNTESLSTNALTFSTCHSFATNGDAQAHLLTTKVETTTATVAGLTNATLVPGNSTTGTMLYEISVVARQVGGSGGTVGDSKGWKLEALIQVESGTKTQIGTTTSTVIGESTGASAWTATLDFSQTLPIRVTGEANKTIHWVAFARAVEVN